MAEQGTHLARGEVQHAPARGIVEKHAFGTNRHEVDELAAIFEQVTPSACPKLRGARNGTLVHHSSPCSNAVAMRKRRATPSSLARHLTYRQKALFRGGRAGEQPEGFLV